MSDFVKTRAEAIECWIKEQAIQKKVKSLLSKAKKYN